MYLVTGGAGFIGSNLCRRLLQQRNEVLCVDHFFLVSCPTNSFTYTFDLVEDLLACGGPGEGSCFRVVGFDEDLDLGDEVLRTDKGSAPDLALGYQSEPAFDLIEP